MDNKTCFLPVCLWRNKAGHKDWSNQLYYGKHSILLIIFSLLFSAVAFSSPGAREKRNSSRKQVFEVDTSLSEVRWQCDKHRGIVKLLRGDIEVTGGVISGGSVAVNMASITDVDIDYELMRLTLQNILKSEEFFNVPIFPEAVFKILHVEHQEGEKFFITGDLTIRGVTRKLGFNARVTIKGNKFVAESEKFCLDRTLWKIMSMSKKAVTSEEQFIVPDQIFFTLKVVANLKKE